MILFYVTYSLMTFDESKSEYNSWDEEGDKLDELISILEANDLSIKAGSRLFRYRRILNALKNEQINDLPNDFTEKHFHQIAIEIHQLHTGITELNESLYFPDWSKKLNFLVSGTELPEIDKNYSARNYQFELYIAGLLKKSGIEPICEEPDIQIKRETLEFGVAVKRPNSFKKLDENLRKARNQIVETDIPGLIIIDVTRISNQPNYIARSDSISSVTNHLIKFLDLFFEKNYNSMRSIVDHQLVFGIVLHIACLCDINDKLGHTSRFTIRNFCSDKSKFMEHLNFFAESLRKSLT